MELNDTILRMYRTIGQLKTAMERILAPAAEQLGMTAIQLVLLLALDCAGPASVGELSRALDMNPGNVSTQCKRLEQGGFLTRTRSRLDERVVNLEMTARGHTAAVRFQTVLDRCSAAMEQLPAPQRESIYTGLETLIEVLNTAARMTADGRERK